jgi:site-specific recombinase XerC
LLQKSSAAWYSLGENGWNTLGENAWYIMGRKMTLFKSFDVSHVVGLRDRALIGVMAYTFARIEAVVTLSVKDYLQSGRRALIRLHEKGGKEKDIPCHHLLETYLDTYIAAAGIAQEKDSPLFRSAMGRTKQLSGRHDQALRQTRPEDHFRGHRADPVLIG